MMDLLTKVDIAKADFELHACEEVLLVGSCFASEIGRRFLTNGFPATVNPYGTMYNPVSILHTLERYLLTDGNELPRIVFLTLGTNHVYRLRETGEIVDNCQKRPAALFREEQLTVAECADTIAQAVRLLTQHRADVKVVVTVSPIRYRKYGYHGSQLSKATLLLAVSQLTARLSQFNMHLYYFPAYEIVLDELRDYRFYASDMLHPSEQAVDYIWERLSDWCLGLEARAYMDEWRPIRLLLGHRPLNPDSPESRQLAEQANSRLQAFKEKYPHFREVVSSY